jgi:ligand-binding sensor domain-containing protein/serine phosphatase RsbU (regulator of sigma subunit)
LKSYFLRPIKRLVGRFLYRISNAWFYSYVFNHLVLLFFSFVFICFAQQTKAQVYPFVNLTVENGLSQGQILSVFQDDDGVMWFGTNGGGIIKFDGHNYEYLTDKDGLADNFIYCIVKDKKGNLLIGTSNGLSVYFPRTTSQKRFKNYTTKDGLSNNLIFNIIFDNDSNALLATSRGISKFNGISCTSLKLNKKLDTSSVFHLLLDSTNSLWCSTLGNGVFKYNTTETKNYTTQNGLQNNMVFGVLERNKNTFWILTGEGLCELYHENIKHLHPPELDSVATFYSYYLDKTATLWLGTSNGLLKCTSDNNFYLFRKNNGLVDNSIWKIMQDRESNLWFASDQNGISKLASQRFYNISQKDGLTNDNVIKLYQNKEGSYWIGSKSGFCVYKNKQIIYYNHKDIGGSSYINAITQDSNGNYLIGTGNGLVVFNGKTFKRIINNDKESQINVIYDVLCGDDGTVWLATQLGIAIVDNNLIQPFNKSYPTKSAVYTIFKDIKNNYWFGAEDGLYQYNGKTLKRFDERDNFTKERVRSIVSDKLNNLWFATHVGLYKYNGNTFTVITDKEGLFSNDVLSLVIDKKGNIWAGFSNGIDKITEENGSYKIKHYGVEDGFMGQECSQNAMIINNDGQVVVGTSKGIMFYNEQFDKENILEPITKLKSIDLFYQKTDWTDYSDSVNTSNIPYNLKLPYTKNYLTFNFIGVSLTTPDKVNYKYMLKGIDKDWRLTKKTEAVYSNIPSGNYEFILFANNGEGVWNKTPLIFKFKIEPPFWRTWWFYSIILLIILSGIYSYLKIRTANKKILKQNGIIEEKNTALQQANKKIAEKNQNITDSINYANRIQQSFLTSEKNLKQTLTEYFILFKPRDIVSGDFYLAFDLPDRTIIICSDCTGHGIPGAFMSLISISSINEIIYSKGIFSTEKILEELRANIIKGLNPEKNESGGKDGMDISLVTVFKKEEANNTIKINFSGGNNSLYIVTSNANGISMNEYKGDKQPVGYYSIMKPFKQQEIFAQKGDIIYLFTDGYADQFGGQNGKKFMSKQLKQKLTLISNLPLNEQKKQLEDTFAYWKADLEQVDDVTVMGIKI